MQRPGQQPPDRQAPDQQAPDQQPPDQQPPGAMRAGRLAPTASRRKKPDSRRKKRRRDDASISASQTAADQSAAEGQPVHPPPLVGDQPAPVLLASIQRQVAYPGESSADYVDWLHVHCHPFLLHTSVRVDDPAVVAARYRDTLRRILDLALPMQVSGVLDPDAIRQIVDISTTGLAAPVRGGHVPQRGGRADRGGRVERGGRAGRGGQANRGDRGGGRTGGRAERGEGRRVRARRG
ncbi:hypothetical protein RIF29_21255 [Crotalaria pallida]|uniref:Uncharacterized protein n=1 Tax=Crotalaria pallida TaxID=3830 RepID=A0AAN9I887_CROPI